MSRKRDVGGDNFSMMRATLDKQFAVFLRQKRGGMPYREFARKLGISKSSVARLEMGEESITLKHLDQVLKRLKCEPGDVFGPPKRLDG